MDIHAHNNSLLLKQFERLALGLVLANAGDKPLLRKLADEFTAIFESAQDSGFMDIADLAGRAARELDECITMSKGKAETVLEKINNMAKIMQDLLLENRFRMPVAPLQPNPAKEKQPNAAPSPDIRKTSPPVQNHDDRKPGSGTSKPDSQPDLPRLEELKHPGKLPDFVDRATFADFLGRQHDVLQDLEQLIMHLEHEPDENRLIELKRIIHNYKGEAALLGLEEVKRLCHVMEDAINAKKMPDIADVLLSAKDWMQHVFEFYAGTAPDPGPVAGLVAELQKIHAQAGEPSVPPIKIHVSDAILQTAEGRKRCEQFTSMVSGLLESLHEKLLILDTHKKDGETIQATIQVFHDMVKLSARAAQSTFMRLCLGAETLMGKISETDMPISTRVMDLLYDIYDGLRTRVDEIENALVTAQALPKAYHLDELVKNADDLSDELTHSVVLPADGKSGSDAAKASSPATGIQTSGQPEKNGSSSGRPGRITKQVTGNAKQPDNRALKGRMPSGREQTPGFSDIIKIEASRLDLLINNIGEMVITESKLCQMINAMPDADPEILRLCGHLDKLTHELHELGTNLRMVPVRPTFLRMSRLVRDLSRRTGKKVDFIMSGAETEIDKAMVDGLGDPLMHLIRNAMDHGIEDNPAARKAAGKSEKGRIELKAFHKGGSIYIEITDDGRGINSEAIERKARETGIIRKGVSWDEHEIRSLIFHPGFSTADKVTDLSGRGVGLDIVKEKIDSLQGHIEISSRRGYGSTFTIRLPLTLSIIDGMVINSGGVRYIIPTLSINRCVSPKKHDLHSMLGRITMLRVDDRQIPCHRLDVLLGGSSSNRPGKRPVIVVMEDNGKLMGLIVDSLEGKQQIVIKTLGKIMQNIPGISGGAILPDGTVGLIINVAGMINMMRNSNSFVNPPEA